MDIQSTAEVLDKSDGDLNVTPVTEYDPFEAKFCASLYWLVFQATEDGTFDNVPSQVTSPVLRDNDRITVRPEVVEFLTHGEIYSRVCNCIYPDKVTPVGHWAVIQMLSRHGVYVVEDGDIAVTDSALQQKKPFRKSTHLSLMDALMMALASQLVDTQKVVKCIRRISSFNASRELPFDMEDSLLLWVNKVCSALNAQQLKKQKLQAEQLLLNQDKAKRFRFRRDQLQPKVQSTFPCLEELLKDVSDGQCLLGIVLFYQPQAFDIQDICFGKDLSTEQIIKNVELFRIKCSQFICTSALSLKVEDIMYGSQAMKPNIIALLAEMFHKCEGDQTETSKTSQPKQKSTQETRCIDSQMQCHVTDSSTGNEGNMTSESTSTSGCVKSTSAPEHLCRNEMPRDSIPQRTVSEGVLNKFDKTKSYRSPFQLDFTDDLDLQCDKEITAPPTTNSKDKQNPFNGIFQKPVLAGKGSTPRGGENLNSPGLLSDNSSSFGDNGPSCATFKGGVCQDNARVTSESDKDQGSTRLPVDTGSDNVNMSGSVKSSVMDGVSGGSPRLLSRQDQPLLLRRMKQKQRSLILDGVDAQHEGVEELKLHDLQRSHSLNSGLDNARVGPRHSFHAWQDTSSSLSESNLDAPTSNRISLQFRLNQFGHNASVQKEDEGMPDLSKDVARGSPTMARKLQSSSRQPKNSLTGQTNNDKEMRRNPTDQFQRNSVASATESLKEFEQIEAMLRAEKEKEAYQDAPDRVGTSLQSGEDDELNVSCTSDDMNKFRMEVLRRVSEDKEEKQELQEDIFEMEDDDDPILLARRQAAISPQQDRMNGTKDKSNDVSLECPKNAEQMDLLSPITETSEPNPSIPSNDADSIPSRGSTAPSSPCSPLDVAPFNPTFLTTSPVNTEETPEEFDQRRQSAPVLSYTPRLQSSSKRGNIVSFHSISFDTHARGSYTVDQVSMETAKAAGIPVIGVSEMSDNSDDENDQDGDAKGSLENALNSLRNVISEERSKFPATSSNTASGHKSSSSHCPLKSSSVNPVENTRSNLASGDLRHESAECSQHVPGTMVPSSEVQSATEAISSPGDDLIIYDRQRSIGQNTNEDNEKNRGAVRPLLPTEQFGTFVKQKKTEPLVFAFDEKALNQFQQPRSEQKRSADGENGRHFLPKDGNSSLEANEEDRDDTDAKPKGSAIGRFSTFRKDTKPTVVQLSHGNEIPAPTDLSKSASDDKFTTYRKTKHDLETQLNETTASSEVVVENREGGPTGHSSIPTSDIRKQFSPGSVTRSKTFRKSTGTSEFAWAKSHDETPKKETSEPLSSSPSPRSMIPQLQLHVVGQENKQSENKNFGLARISWSETGDNLTVTPRQPAATAQARSSTPTNSRSPRNEKGRSSPSARINWVTAAKSGIGGQVFLNDKDHRREPIKMGE